jgi:type III secretion protein R
VYVTTPLIGEMYQQVQGKELNLENVEQLKELGDTLRPPLQAHLARFANETERGFLISATETIWSAEARADLRDDDLVVLIPAFVSSELTRAFEIGFLLYIPFLVVDLLVSNVLMAMGMSMVSPPLISIPLKILLFVSLSGWSRLMHGLILSYG